MSTPIITASTNSSGVDLSQITSAFTASGVIQPVLGVVLILASIYGVIMYARLVLAFIRGDDFNDYFGVQLFDRLDKDRRFNQRHKRESANSDYRAWKKIKGYK
jgi:hypothetical protein